MKLSVHGGRLRSFLAMQCRPYLNGAYLPDCVEVDTYRGRAIAHTLDANGRPFLLDGRVAQHVVTGHLTIKPPPLRILCRGWFWREIWRYLR